MDANGAPTYRWNPRVGSLNPAAWSSAGKSLIVPILDGAGWHLRSLDPFTKTAPVDLELPGYAVVQSVGSALYAVRAGESAGTRELWRLDGPPRRLAFDVTLLDIVNWRADARGVWLPDRGERALPRLVLHDSQNGAVLRSVAAPGLAASGTGLAVDARGPIYRQTAQETPQYVLLTVTKRAFGQ